MLWAVQAPKASSGMVLARSGAPLTWNLPSVHSRSSSATSSSWAASTRARSPPRPPPGPLVDGPAPGREAAAAVGVQPPGRHRGVAGQHLDVVGGDPEV